MDGTRDLSDTDRLFRMDFGLSGAVRNDGIRKISPQALARAGAIVTPPQPNE